jgi:hypothetical protein
VGFRVGLDIIEREMSLGATVNRTPTPRSSSPKPSRYNGSINIRACRKNKTVTDIAISPERNAIKTEVGKFRNESATSAKFTTK